MQPEARPGQVGSALRVPDTLAAPTLAHSLPRYRPADRAVSLTSFDVAHTVRCHSCFGAGTTSCRGHVRCSANPLDGSINQVAIALGILLTFEQKRHRTLADR